MAITPPPPGGPLSESHENFKTFDWIVGLLLPSLCQLKIRAVFILKALKISLCQTYTNTTLVNVNNTVAAEFS